MMLRDLLFFHKQNDNFVKGGREVFFFLKLKHQRVVRVSTLSRGELIEISARSSLKSVTDLHPPFVCVNYSPRSLVAMGTSVFEWLALTGSEELDMMMIQCLNGIHRSSATESLITAVC